MTQVLILMATYNGARFLAEQLESIAKQTHQDWRLLVSDDGSTDQTLSILQDFQRQRPIGQIEILDGPRKGATANFRSLLRRVDLQGQAVAFCDQDDVWDADHLARALSGLLGTGTDLAVYGSRLRICDTNLKPIGLSSLPQKPLGFRNALIESLMSGNTMVLNPAAAVLLQRAEPLTGPIPIHDWWAYQLVTGAGGRAVFGQTPSLSYRQHAANVIGARMGLRSLPARIKRHLRGSHREWAAQNSAALGAARADLTAENAQVLDLFTEALDALVWRRLAALRKAGVYYQSSKLQAAFWVSAALGGFSRPKAGGRSGADRKDL